MKRLDIFIHQPVRNARMSKRVQDTKTHDVTYRVKGSGNDWFVQSENEEEVGDRSFKTRAEAEAYKKQLESKKSKDQTGRHHPETGGVKTPIVDAVRRILDGKVFAQDYAGDEIQYRGYIIMEKSNGKWEIDAQGGRGLPDADSLADAKYRIDQHKAGRS